MRMLLVAAVFGLGLSAQDPGPPAAQAAPERHLQITFEPGGYVSLKAQNVTLREILAEWSRSGGCQFVNAERLTGGPLTLEYEHQPETEVVASLLRQTAGYILGPRQVGTVGASRFETVYITPTSRPVSSGSYPPPAPNPATPIVTPGSPDDELAPIGLMPGGRGNMPPTPEVQPEAGQRPTAPGAVPGVAVPVVPIVPVGPTPPTTGGGRGNVGAGS